jgi:hypothetical protein
MAKNIKSVKPMTNLNNEEWKQILLDDELLTDCSYLGYCMNETLRVDPSLRFSTVHEIVLEIAKSVSTTSLMDRNS